MDYFILLLKKYEEKEGGLFVDVILFLILVLRDDLGFLRFDKFLVFLVILWDFFG